MEEFKNREYLQNTLLIILGDHSSTYNDDLWLRYYEEIFTTPLIMTWEGFNDTLKIKKNNYSQIDIMPTILDLFDLGSDLKFLGKSVFNDDSVRTAC